MIKIKRVYEKPGKDDGCRILIDGVWPRGILKKEAKIEVWLKAIAPSLEIRKWFIQNPDKWEEFQEKYSEELERKKSVLNELKKLEKRRKIITLIYSAKDEERDNIIILKRILQKK
jgi:uncharacterized protein YeaO (DUF488 family)